MNVKSGKKKAFYASIVSMILCLSMLIGTTLAWFTDTAVNAGNHIVTGSLDVELHMYDEENGDYVDISGKTGDVFNLDKNGVGNGNGLLWEPGKTKVVFLKVLNKGKLALDYNILVDVAVEAATAGEAPANIETALNYAVLADTSVADYDSSELKATLEAAQDGKGKWNLITDAAGVENVGNISTGRTTAAPNGALEVGDEEYFALAIHMDENAGNKYQGHTVNLNVAVSAKQRVSESDSFGNQYDENAKFEVVPTGNEPYFHPYYPGVEGAKNLFVNPGFEELDNSNMPVNWTVKKGASVVTDDVHSGDNAAYVTGTDNYFMQAVYLEPNTTYQLSFWTQTAGSDAATNRSSVKLEFFSDPERDGQNLTSKHLNEVSGYVDHYSYEDWFRYSYQFTTPASCNYIQFFFRHRKGAGTWIDDVELMQIGDTEALDLRTDHIFYYPEWGNINVTATAVDQADSDKYVKFYLKKGDDVIAPSPAAIPLNGQVATFGDPEGAASYSFDIDLIPEEDYMEEYTVEAVLCDANGNQIDSTSGKEHVTSVVTTDVYRSSRPLNLNEDGTFNIFDENRNVVDDSFVASIGYHVLDDFNRMRSLGINTIQSQGTTTPEATLKRLDVLQEAGVMALIKLDFFSNACGAVSNAEACEAIIKAVKDHPAVLGYMILDEPGDNSCDEEAMKNSYKIIRRNDKTHAVYACCNDDFGWSSPYVDIMALDPYPGGVGNTMLKLATPTNLTGTDKVNWQNENRQTFNEQAVLFSMYNDVIDARAEIGYDMPFYMITQAFTYQQLTPTYDDMKTQLYLSMLARAQGIGYFSLKQTVPDENGVQISVKDSEIFVAAKDFEDDESEILYDFFIRGKGELIGEYLAADEDGFIWSDATRGVDYRYSIWRPLDENGNPANYLYAMIIDGDVEADTTNIAITDENGNAINSFTATPVGKLDKNGTEGTPVNVDDGILKYELGALKSVLIKIEPNN